MLDMAGVTAQDYVVDLGSGDGRIVIAAARRGARAHGIEYDSQLVEVARRAAQTAGVSERATFASADLFETDFSRATILTLFLLPEINMQLRPKILSMAPGTRVVSNTWTMQDWEPDESVTLPGCQPFCTAHLWIVPATVDGRWALGGGRELILSQRFQTVQGSIIGSTGTMSIEGGRLRGDQLSFTASGGQYLGRVEGEVIQGTMASAGRTEPWRAKLAHR
jgi:hypothetical protein